MATFPTTWDNHLSDASSFEIHDNVIRDLADDGTVITRVLGPSRTRITAQFEALSGSAADALLAFLESNRSGQIDWTVDSKNYQGVLMSPPQIQPVGVLRNVTFEFIGVIV